MLDKPFTLNLTPNDADPTVTDLIDEHGTAQYRKQRRPGSVYNLHITDPHTSALLATATAPAATSKHKTIELHNPSVIVELKYVGTISFRWAFKWEEHEFEWKREECHMIRKPDPPVLVAITKEPPGRIKTSNVQILDYNLNRFDIEDRKGFEIALLTALLTFQDSNEAARMASSGVATSSTLPSLAKGKKPSTPEATPPAPPPKPAPKTGLARIQENMSTRTEYNEVLIEEDGSVRDFARIAVDLLADDAMLFVTIRSSSSSEVPKVLQVVEEIKRIKRKEDARDEELHQYVLYDKDKVVSEPPNSFNSKSRDNGKDKERHRPPRTPNSLTIYISKIPMPELEPRIRPRINLDERPAPAIPALQTPRPPRREHSASASAPAPVEPSDRHRKDRDKDRNRDKDKEKDRHRGDKKTKSDKLEKSKKKKDRPPPPDAYGYGSAATGSSEVRAGFSPLTPTPSFPIPTASRSRTPVGPSFAIPPLPPPTHARRYASESHGQSSVPTHPGQVGGAGVWTHPGRQGGPLNSQAGQPVGVYERIWG